MSIEEAILTVLMSGIISLTDDLVMLLYLNIMNVINKLEGSEMNMANYLYNMANYLYIVRACQLIGSVFLGLLLSFNSYATVVSFDNWEYNTGEEIDWRVTIDDETSAGNLTFNVYIESGSPIIGDITGFGFDTNANSGLDYSPDILNFISNATESLGTRNNANWQGTAVSNIQYRVAVSCSGASCPGGTPDYITSFSFDLDAQGQTLEEDTITAVAIRGQSVGSAPDGGGGSVKDFSVTSTVHAVPEIDGTSLPSAFMLMLGLIMLFRERFRRIRRPTSTLAIA